MILLFHTTANSRETIPARPHLRCVALSRTAWKETSPYQSGRLGDFKFQLRWGLHAVARPDLNAGMLMGRWRSEMPEQISHFYTTEVRRFWECTAGSNEGPRASTPSNSPLIIKGNVEDGNENRTSKKDDRTAARRALPARPARSLSRSSLLMVTALLLKITNCGALAA
jgi:hypothetical protein